MRDKHKRQTTTSRDDETWRSSAQVDADRVFYSPEFRRLSGVTQVVPPQDGYQFHDRLSHSLKVAQVAASLARQLRTQARAKPELGELDLDEWVDPDYCYVAALVHDIGHPPFGHAGEQVLQELMRDASGTEPSEADLPMDAEDEFRLERRSFEGNAQSTRIATRLSFRKDRDEPGLNLTLRSLAGIAKYPWLRFGHPAHIAKLGKKWSFYPEEVDLLGELESEGFIFTEHDPDTGRVTAVHRWVEAEIMDWADDITYAVHDLEDFYRAGMIPLARIRTAVEAAPDAVDWVTTDFDFVKDDEIRLCFQFIKSKLERLTLPTGKAPTSDEVAVAWQAVRESVAVHMPPTPFDGSRKAHAQLQKFGSTLIITLTTAASLHATNIAGGRIQLTVEPWAVVIAELFKSLNAFFVIENSTLATMQYGQGENLSDLFSSLCDLSRTWLTRFENASANRRLPARLREYLEGVAGNDEIVSEDVGPRIAVAVVDYLCGLRDVQAIELAGRMQGSREALSISSRWLDS